MINEVHLVAVQGTEQGLQQVLKPSHMRYAQRFNRIKGCKAHVWQRCYFSSPLYDDFVWAAIRYVERNPVRTGKVRTAEKYRWFGAAEQCRLRIDDVLTKKPRWHSEFDCIRNWSAWLAEGGEPEEMAVLRRNVEKKTGKALQFSPRGRPGKESDE